MINNCAGGITPWGTYLSAEENVNGNFWGKVADDHPEAENYKRMGIPGNWYNWGAYHDRFDVSKEPNEANRFGWMVEIDPLDPTSTPKKRTALGRFKHEGAESIVNKDGRVVVYMGDDERFDYVYKFVTEGKFNPNDRAANMDLLDKGTLYVARYDESGKGEWLPLVHGQGKLTAENGFKSQADVVIQARKAGDLLGATKMDRPEDVEPNPKTGKVYVMLTNNGNRKPEDVNAANPRANNAFGHIIEMTPTGGDHASTTFAWDIMVKCGDPSVAEVGASFNPATSPNGWFGMPDNCAVDNQGRLWVATDGNSYKDTRTTDGVWAMETDGEMRGTSQAVLPRAGRGRDVRPALHSGRQDAVRRGAAPGHRQHQGLAGIRQIVQLRGPGHPLAGLQGRHAAAPLGGRHHQGRRRRDRRLIGFSDGIGTEGGFGRPFSFQGTFTGRLFCG